MLAVLVLLATSACAREHVRTAPFRNRPDSVNAGDLRGPFDGRVVEALTGKPVAGALVYATWTFESGYGMAQPAGFQEFVTNTDASGRYTIPALTAVPERDNVRLTDFYLVVYKRGYVAYRNDRRFGDFGPRRDFAQQNHYIELERWQEDYSHARHLRYIGGGPAIAALTAWETEEAALELASAGAMRTDRLPTPRGTYLVAAQLLGGDDVREVTGFDGTFESGPLGDEPDTATYSSQHLKAMGRPETYDVALRVWRLEPDEAQKRYGTLIDSLPGVDETNEIGDRSLRAAEGNIFGVGFLDSRRGVVALLTCGQNQCASMDAAVRLATKIHERIQALTPAGATP